MSPLPSGLQKQSDWFSLSNKTCLRLSVISEVWGMMIFELASFALGELDLVLVDGGWRILWVFLCLELFQSVSFGCFEGFFSLPSAFAGAKYEDAVEKDLARKGLVEFLEMSETYEDCCNVLLSALPWALKHNLLSALVGLP